MAEEIDYTKWEYPESELEIVEEFNGYVIEIDKERHTFWIDCEDKEGERLHMEIQTPSLPLAERPHLQMGAYCRYRFYQDPDYKDNVIEEFIFYKRQWSQEEIDAVEKKVDEACKVLGIERKKDKKK